MTHCAFIEPAWLTTTRAKAFFYPTAGSDWAEPLQLFGEHIDEFWFADIAYPRGLSMEPVYKRDADYQLLSRTLVGDPTAAIEYRRDKFGREYRYLPPSILRE